MLQAVVQHLRQLLADGSSTGSSRYAISSHPKLPVAVLVGGSGPHCIDPHTSGGERGGSSSSSLRAHSIVASRRSPAA
jgi:hypothetical protein